MIVFVRLLALNTWATFAAWTYVFNEGGILALVSWGLLLPVMVFDMLVCAALAMTLIAWPFMILASLANPELYPLRKTLLLRSTALTGSRRLGKMISPRDLKGWAKSRRATPNERIGPTCWGQQWVRSPTSSRTT